MGMAKLPNDFDWTVTQASEETGRDPSFIRAQIRKGNIRGKKINSRLTMVSVSSMKKFDETWPRRERRDSSESETK